MQRAAEILDERRRRRGSTPESLDWASLKLLPGTSLNNRETLRLALSLRRQRSRQVQGARESENSAHNILAVELSKQGR